MSSDLTFLTNEQGNALSDRFRVLLGDNTRHFDVLVGNFFVSGFRQYRVLLRFSANPSRLRPCPSWPAGTIPGILYAKLSRRRATSRRSYFQKWASSALTQRPRAHVGGRNPVIAEGVVAPVAQRNRLSILMFPFCLRPGECRSSRQRLLRYHLDGQLSRQQRSRLL